MEILQIGELTIEMVRYPRHTLSDRRIQDIIDEAVPLARAAFRNEGITKSDILTHAIEVSTALYIRDSKGNLIAFSTCVTEEVLGYSIVHLKGTAIHPAYQGLGLYSLLSPIRILLEAENIPKGNILVGTRTQNPRVYEKLSKLGLYPKLGEPVPEWIKPVAEEYAKIIWSKHSDFRSVRGLEFDRDLLVIRRAYGLVTEDGKEITFCLYGEDIPRARDPDINMFLWRLLDFNNGDAILLIGPYSRDLCIDMINRYEGNTDKVIKRFLS